MEHDELIRWCARNPTAAARYITQLRADAHCPSVATWGARCDLSTGHSGRHSATGRDHGDLHPTTYYWP